VSITVTSQPRERQYNVVEVIGSGMPSQNAKYVATQHGAQQAARRIHKKV
jgi:hypothetical protein